MKTFFKYIALIALLLSTSYAEETLEERKKRIMRKYFREQVVVYNSDLVVEDNSNEEKIKESRNFLVEDNEFLKHEKNIESRNKASNYINKKMYNEWVRKKILLDSEVSDEYIIEDEIINDSKNNLLEDENRDTKTIYNRGINMGYENDLKQKEFFPRSEINKKIPQKITTQESIPQRDIVRSPIRSRYTEEESEVINRNPSFKSYGVKRRDPAGSDKKLNDFIDKYTR